MLTITGTRKAGYHQRVKPGTLVGADRREARQQAISDFNLLLTLPIDLKVIENPIGAFNSIMKPSQIIQPYEFGDDASKKTCLWLADRAGQPVADKLDIDPSKRVAGRLVNGRERWSNQTNSGQNRLSPSSDRWKTRSRTYPGIADAICEYVDTYLNSLAFSE